eukprot:scaffold14.g1190.t1
MGSKSKKEKKEKRRKEKRRRRESSTESSSSDDEERKRRRAAKLAKKVAQHLQKHSTGGAGYSNEDNPFGDTNLTERFVWGKKIEKQLAEGVDVRELTARAEARRHAERLEEIEKVKKRREQREAEREAMQAELEMIQRERALAEAVELEKKEEEFHLEQAKMRTRQRITEGRTRPIDLLACNVFPIDGMDPRLAEPNAVLHGLGPPELREVQEGMAIYLELDRGDRTHKDFWEALAAVTEHELAEAVKQEEIDRARLRGQPPPAQYTVREAGWHDTIDADVQTMLAGKGYRELAELEESIQDQLDTGAAGDPEYWAAVLKRLGVAKARARVREVHTGACWARRAEMVGQVFARITGGVNVAEAMGWGQEEQQQQQQQQEEEEYPEEQERSPPPPPNVAAAAVAAAAAAAAAEAGNEEEIALPEEEEEEGGSGAAAAGAKTKGEGEGLDPELLELALAGRPGGDEAAGAVKRREASRFQQAAALAATVSGRSTASAEAERLYRQMVADPGGAARMLGSTSVLLRNVAAPGGEPAPPAEADAEPAAPPGAPLFPVLPRKALGSEVPQGEETDAERSFRVAAAKQMGDLGTSGDAPFGGEVELNSQVYWWHEKYRPRKPKYFNRVHTGYEWNRYNQTHYDGDNPPPKTVQGYKFNVFYPELIEKSKAPSYSIDKDPASPDGSTCILRFHAGPPYEDIAFRIVNKEWEYNHKRGFKCSFERGILHLYFNFHRQRYRR